MEFRQVRSLKDALTEKFALYHDLHIVEFKLKVLAILEAENDPGFDLGIFHFQIFVKFYCYNARRDSEVCPWCISSGSVMPTG